MASSLSFHKIALEPIIKGLKNAHHVISKGEAHAKTQELDPSDLLTARLYPDMFTLTQQVQRFTDTAKFIPSRVNPENPTITLADEETTFPELLDRIQRTIKYVESIDEKSFDGKEDSEITLYFGGGTAEAKFTAAEYVLNFGHPNFWFHVTTAYDILRMKGVALSKIDYLNGAGLKEYKMVQKKEEQ